MFNLLIVWYILIDSFKYINNIPNLSPVFYIPFYVISLFVFILLSYISIFITSTHFFDYEEPLLDIRNNRDIFEAG